MAKKRLYVGVLSAVVILIVTLFVVAIEVFEREDETVGMELYFFNETATSIEAEQREIKYDFFDDLTEVVIEKLFSGPVDNKHKPIFEKGVELLSVDEDDGNLIVDFSKEYMYEDLSRTYLATYALVKSLCQINGINSVMVTVEGDEITDTEGKAIGFLSDKDIDLVSDEITKDSKSITLYFPDKSSDKLLKEERNIKINDTIPIEQYVVNEIIKGTQSQKSRNVISQDTVLISAQTTDDTCFVNFKGSFTEKNTGDSIKEKLVIYSIVNSLCEIKGVNFVQFFVDGKKTDKFGNVDISGVFTRDVNLIAGQ